MRACVKGTSFTVSALSRGRGLTTVTWRAEPEGPCMASILIAGGPMSAKDPMAKQMEGNL